MARLTIGSTDFSVDVYNYNREASNPLDYDQKKFDIKHDKDRIIPLVHRASASAIATGAPLRILSSSWSPPGWMKVPYLAGHGTMRNSAKPGMVSDPKIHASYALYISKYLAAYSEAGINISMITVQNEPDSADHMFPVAYPACNFNGTGEGLFVRDHLGPIIRSEHPGVKIMVHDGQKFHDVPIVDRVSDIVAAANGTAFIDGVAFHWYGNNLKNYQFLAELRKKYPRLTLLATEATLEDPATQHITTSPWKEAQKYGVDIIGDLNEGTVGWIEWNVLLDSSGGPTCIGPTGTDGCVPLAGHCDAPILADTKKQTLEIRDSYHVMAHFARFIPRGSRQLFSSGLPGTNGTLMGTAAVAPNGDIVAVVLNTDPKAEAKYQFAVPIGGSIRFAALAIPPHGIQTLTLKANATKKAAPLGSRSDGTSVAASLRSDVWRKDLPEAKVSDPTNGRRVQVVVDSLSSMPAESSIKSVKINGQELVGLDSSKDADITHFDWGRIHTNTKTGSLWVSFHTHNTGWLTDAIELTAVAANGTVIIDSKIPLVQSDAAVALTYVAFRSSGREAVLHLHNYDKNPHTLTAVTFDGITVPVPASVTKLSGGAHAMLVVTLAGGSMKASGDVWTATVAIDGRAAMGFGGRASTNERLVVTAWPHSDDCPVPGGNDADSATGAEKIGMNSVLLTGSKCGKGKADTIDLANKLATNNASRFHVFISPKIASSVSAEARRTVVDANFIGDEVDGTVDAEHLRPKLGDSVAAIKATPELLTYAGSKTTRNVGSFAGLTDIQGSDAYSAACAPTMLAVSSIMA